MSHPFFGVIFTKLYACFCSFYAHLFARIFAMFCFINIIIRRIPPFSSQPASQNGGQQTPISNEGLLLSFFGLIGVGVGVGGFGGQRRNWG